MASLAATKGRLWPWMKLLPPTTTTTTTTLQILSRALVSSELSNNHFHCGISRPPTIMRLGKRSPQILHPSRPCLCVHKQAWSSVPLHVPQVDLDSEKKMPEESSEEGSSVKSASEVLQNLGPEDTRRLKIIKLEFDVTEQMYGKVPEVMTDDYWLHALRMDSKSKRLRYYRFLYKNENLKKSKKRKQTLRQQEKDAAPVEREEPQREKNTIFFHIRDATIKQAGNYRLAHAMQFGQPLVFDMDYEQHMRHQDCQNLVFQLLLSYGKNRDSLDPFHLVFTSMNPRGRVLQMLHKSHLTGSNFLGTMTDKSYLEFFPRERLVYLSPHASQSLTEVSEDDVYIVGGIVDKTNTQPLSLARAKEQGIRVAKFPLDNYLLWGQGTKSLTLDQVMAIMLEQRRSKDWNDAFRAIPQRKLQRDDYR
ncbi:hypothetical protein ACOMHN_022209 [Nucella lapillus]